jgi:hypothetical protein
MSGGVRVGFLFWSIGYLDFLSNKT